MPISRVTGKYYNAGIDDVSFFGIKGVRTIDGIRAINFGWVPFQSDFQSIIDVRRFIECSVADGNSDKIAQLRLSARQAVIFYLGGELLSPKHFERAVEGGGYIDIPNVDVYGRELTVRILDNDLGIATADSDGKIL